MVSRLPRGLKDRAALIFPSESSHDLALPMLPRKESERETLGGGELGNRWAVQALSGVSRVR